MAQQSFVCDQCSAAFVSEALLDGHRQLHQQAPLAVACRFCGEAFADESLLEAHAGQEHGGLRDESLPCPECGATWPTTARLEEHLAVAHPHFPGMTRGG